jgi:hypothetical protein
MGWMKFSRHDVGLSDRACVETGWGDLSFLKDNRSANGNYARLLAPAVEKHGVGEGGSGIGS